MKISNFVLIAVWILVSGIHLHTFLQLIAWEFPSGFQRVNNIVCGSAAIWGFPPRRKALARLP